MDLILAYAYNVNTKAKRQKRIKEKVGIRKSFLLRESFLEKDAGLHFMLDVPLLKA